jgi:hypothetical protein
MSKAGLYQAYLVRLWPTQRQGIGDYRVTTQDVASGERCDFPDLASLLAFWRGLTAPQEIKSHVQFSSIEEE